MGAKVSKEIVRKLPMSCDVSFGRTTTIWSFHGMISSFHGMIPSFYGMISSFHAVFSLRQRDKSAKVIGYKDEVIRL